MMVVLPFIIVGQWGKDEWVEMRSMSLESYSCFDSSTCRSRRAHGLARTVASEPLVLLGVFGLPPPFTTVENKVYCLVASSS